jgi:hypothetical protein
MSKETTYWGILCRTCSEPVAFDVRPYHEFGLGSANIRPGAIRCARGHNHIYFPRDFHFFPSSVPITEESMQKNRAIYLAINRSSEPALDAAPANSPRDQSVPQVVRPAGFAPDARREATETAKIRWAHWASKKVI